jgi:hypothetical protein
MRVARSREPVAQGRPAAVVARVVQISRQAIYRRPKRPPLRRRRAGSRTTRLGRLVLPDPCPTSSEPLSAAALDGADDAVSAILFTGDRGTPSLEVRPARSTDPVPTGCTDVPRDRIARVDVRFPNAAADKTYLVSVQNCREVVWARVR